MQENCLICDRIKLISQDANPYFVKELETGYVVIGDHQYFPGYTVFLYKEHARELHDIAPEIRRKFLWEMSEVAAAVSRAFLADKMNHALLGNTDEHMHWHLFPRQKDEPYANRAVWSIPLEIRNAAQTKPTKDELAQLKQKLLMELGR